MTTRQQQLVAMAQCVREAFSGATDDSRRKREIRKAYSYVRWQYIRHGEWIKPSEAFTIAKHLVRNGAIFI